jgi:hypothetical protein
VRPWFSHGAAPASLVVLSLAADLVFLFSDRQTDFDPQYLDVDKVRSEAKPEGGDHAFLSLALEELQVRLGAFLLVVSTLSKLGGRTEIRSCGHTGRRFSLTGPSVSAMGQPDQPSRKSKQTQASDVVPFRTMFLPGDSCLRSSSACSMTRSLINSNNSKKQLLILGHDTGRIRGSTTSRSARSQSWSIHCVGSRGKQRAASLTQPRRSTRSTHSACVRAFA